MKFLMIAIMLPSVAMATNLKCTLEIQELEIIDHSPALWFNRVADNSEIRANVDFFAEKYDDGSIYIELTNKLSGQSQSRVFPPNDVFPSVSVRYGVDPWYGKPTELRYRCK